MATVLGATGLADPRFRPEHVRIMSRDRKDKCDLSTSTSLKQTKIRLSNKNVASTYARIYKPKCLFLVVVLTRSRWSELMVNRW